MDRPTCAACGRTPENIDEYVDAAAGTNLTPSEYVRAEEGTYDPGSDQFLCTEDYIRAGMPSSPRGWHATPENMRALAP